MLARWAVSPLQGRVQVIGLDDGEVLAGAIGAGLHLIAAHLRDTRRRQTFNGSEDTGPMLKKDDEFDGSFTVIGDGDPYLVTSWWTRIALADLVVISDVPRDLPAAEPAAA